MDTYNWIGFDFDNTLHFFREASSSATEKTLEFISLEFNSDLEHLKNTYRSILNKAENTYFIENKTSHEYRSERFGKLLTEFEISLSKLEIILDCYENALTACLKEKEGALEILEQCKRMGYKVLIITEAPYDAQERAIEQLGFTKYVDLLETSSRQRLSKSDGLVSHVLDDNGYDRTKGLYVGDSIDRDIEPTLNDGIRAIWLSETKASPSSEIYRIRSLRELLPILQSHAPS